MQTWHIDLRPLGQHYKRWCNQHYLFKDRNKKEHCQNQVFSWQYFRSYMASMFYLYLYRTLVWELHTGRYPLGQFCAVPWFCIELIKTKVNLGRMWRSWLIRLKTFRRSICTILSLCLILVRVIFSEDIHFHKILQADLIFFIYHVRVSS